LFNGARPQVEARGLPLGYELERGGVYEASGDAQAGLVASLPVL